MISFPIINNNFSLSTLLIYISSSLFSSERKTILDHIHFDSVNLGKGMIDMDGRQVFISSKI